MAQNLERCSNCCVFQSLRLLQERGAASKLPEHSDFVSAAAAQIYFLALQSMQGCSRTQSTENAFGRSLLGEVFNFEASRVV